MVEIDVVLNTQSGFVRLLISGTGVVGGTGPEGGSSMDDFQRTAMSEHFIAGVVGSGQTITVALQCRSDSTDALPFEHGFYRAIAIPR
jgi:hypothetical protein